MRVTNVYARFFRSLNYDYLKKTRDGFSPSPWDLTPDENAYPFVKLPLDAAVTAVVGANESGKSQVLDAIEKGLTGDNILRQDFCRYSDYFSRDESLTVPEFGLRLTALDPADREAVAAACELEGPEIGDEFLLFRMNETPKTRVYLKQGESWSAHPVRKPTHIQRRLPRPFEITSRIPLPNFVPLDYLATGELTAAQNWERLRQGWSRLKPNLKWFASTEAVQASAAEIADAMSAPAEVDEDLIRAYGLADDLLVKVAGLDRNLFAELRAALADGRNGYAGGLIENINRQLANSLNFPHWWSQDTDFSLLVEPRQDVLTFQVRDRTGTSYSFAERSAGLKYFLSYFVQYLSHEPEPDGRPEILLMDEPDAYLSASGQQDLLSIFDGFAFPEQEAQAPVQVVYVTHSPFLIDRNHAERVRVLEKGEYDEGTRLVANAARNHYEPLRSALGAFAGETAFIGACNLVLEGVSDQILIAGVSNWLTRAGAPATQRLDLNTITLVPAGGASHIPYVVFLARGRDVDRPAVIVLVDGDSDGDDAMAALERGGPRNKQLLDPRLVFQLNKASLGDVKTSNPEGPRAIEDLVPLPLVIAGVKEYCSEFAPERDVTEFDPSAKEVFGKVHDTHAGIESALRDHLSDADFEINKIGLARSIMSAIRGGAAGPAVGQLEANFKVVLSELSLRQRQAERETKEEKISSRINRARRVFLAAHSMRSRKEDVTLLIEEIEELLDSSPESDTIRATMRGWRRDFDLGEDPRTDVDDFPGLVGSLRSLAYAGVQAVQESETATG